MAKFVSTLILGVVLATNLSRVSSFVVPGTSFGPSARTSTTTAVCFPCPAHKDAGRRVASALHAGNVTADFSENQGDEDGGTNPLKGFSEAADSLLTNPLLGPVLFWTPFLANPNLRRRAAEFLPNINPVAVGAAAIVGAGFIFVRARTDSVADASYRRAAALRALRDARATQLAAGTDAGEVSTAAEAYGAALREELDLRSILPGYRIDESAVPNDPAGADSADAAFARQFLGLNILENGELVPLGDK
eukprot:CAMPEP_0183293744 /NCGR_PEP_ID=MMETSP0160_2-20130417/2321_1 /TAXON_ID=2839 ORGANISM="Odontella Sinensis, Strain Grunow 1884" /NCGR_SAMPLE_ID=MMETSP0160_2 /ASSEMBLY_ACC=CAM_ASM_000250 /LENGTH=248 /DNA_ID=CAMNT_0025454915 /DNA_START=63 /DNA_END=809 /DNA_ORIENTATION=+